MSLRDQLVIPAPQDILLGHRPLTAMVYTIPGTKILLVCNGPREYTWKYERSDITPDSEECFQGYHAPTC